MKFAKLKKKLALLLGSILLVLVLAELVLRVFGDLNYMRPPEKEPDHFWREHLHRPSPIPGLAYQLAPNHRDDPGELGQRTNSFGMHDSEPDLARLSNSVRVVALGDSFTYGLGVPLQQAWPNFLERLFQTTPLAVPRDVQVLNMGVGGYAARDLALVLEHRALDWDPQIVLVGYVLNDPETDPIQPLHAYYQKVSWWQRSALLRLIALAKRNVDVGRFGDGDYYRYLHAPDRDRWRSVKRAFAAMESLAKKHDFQLVLVLFPHYPAKSWDNYPYLDLHEQVAVAAKQHGFHVVDLYEASSKRTPTDLWLNSGDNHPNVDAHQLSARAVFRYLDEQQLVPAPRPLGPARLGRLAAQRASDD